MKSTTTTILIATGALLFGGIATAAYMNNREKPAEFVNATTGEPIDAASTAHYIRAVLEGRIPLPEPIGIQADHIVRACKALEAVGDGSCLQALAA